MNREKLRTILRKQRPDLIDVERETPAAPLSGDLPTDVDEYETTSSAWARHSPKEDFFDMKKNVDTKQGLSADDIRRAFMPRELGGGKATGVGPKNPTQAESVGIQRVIKRNRLTDALEGNTDASGPEAKDLIIDENEGIIGSQG